MEYQSGAISPVETISEGWNIIKDNYWLFFGMTIVAILIIVAASFILSLVNNVIAMGVGAAFGAAAQNSGDTAKTAAAIAPQLVSSFIGIFTNIIGSTISGVLFCGLYKALARQTDTGMADFGDLFGGFQKIVPCLIVAVFLSVIQFIIIAFFLVTGAAFGLSAFGLGMLKNGQIDPAIFSGLIGIIFIFVLIFIVISIVVSTLTTFIYPLISDRNLSGGEAILTSAKAGLANIGGMLGLLILTF